MSKAKTASKNNPKSRVQAKKFLHNGQKIRPVKLVTESTKFMAAEYESTGELVKNDNGKILTWSSAVNQSILNN